MDNKQIDTSNPFIVGGAGEYVQIMMPPRGPISKEKALNLAAWLVAIADPLEEEFPKVLRAIMNA